MKKLFRYAVAGLAVGPFILFVQIGRFLVGKERAVALCGPYGTALAKAFLAIILPRIERPEEFPRLVAGAKARFWLWQPLYDFEVRQDNDDTLELAIWNCPFCELLSLAGVPELNRHVCQGDWEFAQDNQDKWVFARTREIGKGDPYCNHTYRRLTPQPPAAP
ncbi:MAG: L-2-amino-thiazoline-4-carboxylic acid hydrolase [Thermodesulfobacteriota bacterium]